MGSWSCSRIWLPLSAPLLAIAIILTGIVGIPVSGMASAVCLPEAKSLDPWSDSESGLPINPDERNNVRLLLRPERPLATPGQDITLIVEADRQCHLVVLSLPEVGNVIRLWPERLDTADGEVPAATRFRVPGPRSGFSIRVDGSSDSESFVALASTKPEGILRSNDFASVGKTGLAAFRGTRADLSALVSQRVDKLSPSVRWGSTSTTVKVAAQREIEAQGDTVTVTLNVFSGRPNPSWTLSRQQAQELIHKLRSLSAKTFDQTGESPARLGYRGFTVGGIKDPKIGERLEIHDNTVDMGDLAPKRVDMDHGLEQWLLRTGRDAVPSDVRSLVEKELSVLKQLHKRRQPESLVPTSFNPRVWNTSKIVRETNNCYNYANDRITLTFAQPGLGRQCGRRSELTCDEVRKAAQCDGLEMIQNPSEATDGHAVALVIWPGRDYHWYRLDENGKWSHKPGRTPATDLDQQKRQILDPKTCDRGPYKDFCGYMKTVPTKVRIK